MIKNLDDERLGQNKVLCSSSGVELPMVKLPLQVPQHSLRQEDRSPATRRLLTLRTVLTRIPSCCLYLVASFLLPHLARFLARLVGRPRFCFAGS